MGPPQANAPTSRPAAGLATAGLVLGLLSLTTWWLPIVSWGIPVVGVIFSWLGRRSTRRLQATTGLIASAVGLLLGLGYTIYVIYGNLPR
jgi:predicted membrane channel-forming protein YqfA (hemolysin III family)